MAKVCIDPGHGGYDPGAVGPTGLKEKDVNLAVALHAGSFLQAAGVSVVYTRTSDRVTWPSDTNADLAARCKIANQAGADLFISIHCNSATNRSARGAETYCLQLGGQGEKLARAVHVELLRATGLVDRGVKTANFYVLRATKMPAALVELAFISNPDEEKLLKQSEFQARAGRAIAEGVAKILGVRLASQQAPQAAETANAGTDIRVVVHSQTLIPVIVQGRAYVWINDIAQALGMKARWVPDERKVYLE